MAGTALMANGQEHSGNAVHYRQGQPSDRPAVEALLDLCFGADRRQKTSYRLRDQVAERADLWLVATVDDRLIGSVQYWPIRILDDAGPAPSGEALLLGPIAVDPSWQGKGVGMALIARTLEAARRAGTSQVLLVGDAAYYGRAGFSAAATGGLTLPGPHDPARLLSRRIGDGPELPARGRVASAALAPPGEADEAEDEPQPKPGGQQRLRAYA